MIRFATLLIAMLCLARFAGAGASPATKPAKRALPDAASQQKAAKEIREVFGDDFAKVKTPDQKRAFAVKLLGTADQTSDDPTSRYVLLMNVVDLAEEVGDAPHMMAALDRIQQGWQVDGLELKLQYLVKISTALTRPEDRRRFIEFAEGLSRRAEGDERFEAADQLNAIALTAAQAEGDADKIASIRAFGVSLKERAQAFAATVPSRAILKEKPDDSQANLIIGKYECFMKGDWDNGLVKLARGGDAALSALVAQDRAGGSAAPEAQYALGQVWWKLSDQQTSKTAAEQIRRRAAGWYQLALPQLGGAELTEAQGRLNQLIAAGQTPLALAPRQPAAGENAPTTRPSAIAPGGGIVVVNYTDAKEAADVIASVAKNYPDVLQGVGEADLVKFYDGSKMKRNGGELAPIADSYSATPAQKGGGGIFLWGVYEKRGPGKYLVVYRVQMLSEANGQAPCFLDVCSNGKTCASRRPKDAEFQSGQWSDIPIVVDLNKSTELEYRLWPFRHAIALDRLYIFELP